MDVTDKSAQVRGGAGGGAGGGCRVEGGGGRGRGGYGHGAVVDTLRCCSPCTPCHCVCALPHARPLCVCPLYRSLMVLARKVPWVRGGLLLCTLCVPSAGAAVPGR
jgi:hypothetical protein